MTFGNISEADFASSFLEYFAKLSANTFRQKPQAYEEFPTSAAFSSSAKPPFFYHREPMLITRPFLVCVTSATMKNEISEWITRRRKQKRIRKMTSTFFPISSWMFSFSIEKRSIIIQLRRVTVMNQLIWIIGRGSRIGKWVVIGRSHAKSEDVRWCQSESSAVLLRWVHREGKQEPNFLAAVVFVNEDLNWEIALRKVVWLLRYWDKVGRGVLFRHYSQITSQWLNLKSKTLH